MHHLDPARQKELNEQIEKYKTSASGIETRKRAAAAQAIFSSSRLLADNKLIQHLIKQLAPRMSEALRGTAPLFITLYPKGPHFANLLAKELGRLGINLEENYLDLRIENDTVTPRVEPVLKPEELQGRTVVILAPSLRKGRLMTAAIQYFIDRGVRAIYPTTFLNVPTSRLEQHAQLQPSFFAMESDAKQFMGLGFTVDGFFGNEPGLRIPASEESKLSTGSIMTAMSLPKMSAKPIYFNASISPNQQALDRFREAEEILKTLTLVKEEKEVVTQIGLNAEQMKRVLEECDPVMIYLQKGAGHFGTPLTEAMSGMALEECYMHIGSYGHSQHGGEAKIHALPSKDLKDRVVVIIEDLIQSGNTMDLAKKICQEKGAIAVIISVLGDKPQKRAKGMEHVKGDFICFVFGDPFLDGCGLDEKGTLRNLVDIFAYPEAAPATTPEIEVIQEAPMKNKL